MVVDSGSPTVLSAVTAMSSLAEDKAMFCANLSLGTEDGSEYKTSQCASIICHSHASPAHRITNYCTIVMNLNPLFIVGHVLPLW